MIAALMLYGTAIAALIALAAFTAERAFGAFGIARRGVWAAAIASSLLAPPAIIALSSLHSERALMTMPSPARNIQPTITGAPLAAAVGPAELVPTVSRMTTRFSLLQWNSLLAAAWLVTSIALGTLYVVAWMHTRRKLNTWRLDDIAGQTVLLSEDVGPAVFGILKPTIIVPRWLKDTSQALQSLVLEHERQHIQARDQVVLGMALFAVVIAPWNLPLWWQLRRLRFAIEVDCDARVLGRGADAIAYGEALLQVGRRYLRAPTGAIALIEPPSDLERRIRIMTRDQSRHTVVIALACAAVCASLVTVAAQIDPPRVENNELRLPPPRGTLAAQIEATIREIYPELFVSTQEQPAVVKIMLNNDLSIDWSEKTMLPLGTTQKEAEIGEQPKEAVLRRLHPDEPRIVGNLVVPGGIASPPIFVTYAIHAFNEARSPAAVERALKEKFPALYDDAADGNVLLIALMKEDGSVERAVQRPRVPGESLIGDENQRQALETLQAGPIDVGVMAMIGNRKTSPFRPVVLYAFRKSDDPRLDADPMRPVDRAMAISMQRALVERHFPEIADGSTNPHVLLWVLLDQSGDVIATGRDATSPDPLMVNLERHHPGAATARRTTTQLTALFSREMRDTEGQPILATFAWLDDETTRRARARSTAESIALETIVYRNGELVSTTPMTLKVGQPQIQTNEALRLDITAIDASKDLVDIGVVMRVPTVEQGIEFGERWEIVSQPMIRTRRGEAGIIEAGVRYPGKAGDVVWRIELKPRRAS